MELGTVSNFEKNIKAKLNLHVDKVFYFLRILCSCVLFKQHITCGTKAEILAVLDMVCHS